MKIEEVIELRLTPEVLKLQNPEGICNQIEEFVREKVEELHRDGVILGLSVEDWILR